MTSPAPWRPLFKGAGVTIGDYRCNCAHAGEGAEEHSAEHSFAIIRAGMFLKRMGRERTIADSNALVFFNAGESYRVSHPAGCADRCTTFNVHPDLAMSVADDVAARRPTGSRPFASSHALCDARLHHAHHRLLSALRHRAADDLEVESFALWIIGAALQRLDAPAIAVAHATHPRSRRNGSDRADRQRIEAVCAHFTRNLAARITLPHAAAAAHTSPYHLCRIFRRGTGSPSTDTSAASASAPRLTCFHRPGVAWRISQASPSPQASATTATSPAPFAKKPAPAPPTSAARRMPRNSAK